GEQLVLDVGVGAARARPVEALLAQVVRGGRVGVGQRLVLAHHATKLRSQVVEALLFGAVTELEWRAVADDLCTGRHRTGEGQQQAREQHAQVHSRPPRLATRGTSCCSTTSSLTGPTCFQRTTPSASTRKVSGAP